MNITNDAVGSALALATAVFWALSPICFASAGRRIGSFRVALLRIGFASLFLLIGLPVYMLCGLQGSLPNQGQFLWMVGSGLFGMVIGDLLIYESLVRIGAAMTTQILLLAPVVSAVMGWAWMGESLGPKTALGAALILGATSYVVFAQKNDDQASPQNGISYSHLGILIAGGGAVCMGVGAVFGRAAFQSGPPTDPIVMTGIRVVSAGLFLWALGLSRKQGREILSSFFQPGIPLRIILGTACGPLLGMLCYVAALKQAPAGLVSTLVATSPLFVLPMLALWRKRFPAMGAIAAAIIAITGVGLICLR